MPEPSVKIIPDVPVASRAVRPMARAQSLWRTVWRRFCRHRLALCGLRWMQSARLVRAAFLSLKEKEFVEAAVALGTPPVRLVVRHILPNALSPVIVAASLGVGSCLMPKTSSIPPHTGSCSQAACSFWSSCRSIMLAMAYGMPSTHAKCSERTDGCRG